MKNNKRNPHQGDSLSTVYLYSPRTKELYGDSISYNGIHLCARVGFEFHKALRLAIPFDGNDRPYIVESAPDVKLRRDKDHNIIEVIATLKPLESLTLLTKQEQTINITLARINSKSRRLAEYELEIYES